MSALSPLGAILAVGMSAVLAATAPTAHADNNRLNNSVIADIYAAQHQAGCTNDVKANAQLRLAAQWHTVDVLNNRSLNGDIGSDGSTPQDRATAAGFHGAVAETVAINPALAISGLELINQWYDNPDYHAIMTNCANTAVGVWSENSPDRTVVVAVYGQPTETLPQTSAVSQSPPNGTGIDPNPDYDASDELEYGTNWLAWILRGVYPPPAYPPA